MAWKDSELGLLIRLLNPYSTTMYPSGEDIAVAAAPGGQAGGEAQQEAAAAADLRKYHVEVDTYDGTWDFKLQTYRVVRSLKITYRYERKDAPGVFATEHLLIGYAGGNGG